MAKVEFGSVKFFRRLITLIVLLLILILIISLIVTNQKLSKTQDQLDYYKDSCEAMANASYGINQIGEEHFSYESLFPALYAKKSEYQKVYDKDRFFYLTFVGGPSAETEKILDVLSEKNVKATFFISGGTASEDGEILNRIVNEGHSIGVYRSTEKPLSEIYNTVEDYLTEFEAAYNVIYEATGIRPDIFRFPGGTTNKYNALIREPLIAEMIRRGFTYYDWNATGGDNIPGTVMEQIVENAMETAGQKQRVFLNLHDTEDMQYTSKALPQIIDTYAEAGYEFKAITNDVKPMAFD